MNDTDLHCHTASIVVQVPPREAFEYMADGKRQGEWTLGSWNRKLVKSTPSGDIYAGQSLFNGETLYVRPRGNADALLVDYDVGVSPEALVHLISARIIPGSNLGRADDQCVVTLMCWRAEGDDDDQWALDAHTFNTEVFMIKGRLELGFSIG